MTLGTVDCGTWASIRDFFDPRISTSQYLADAYECAQYGSIPSPGTPAPHAPQTQPQMTDPSLWTPSQSYNTGADWWTATVAKIRAAEESGSYNPQGNLPVTATWLDQNKWWLLAGGSAIGLIVLLRLLK